jgi:hypothetical protein
MRCSSLADDFFRYNSDKDELHLPVTYPRIHEATTKWTEYASWYTGLPLPFPGLKYRERVDKHMAYIRPDEIRNYIVPWLREMETYLGAPEDKKPNVTRVDIPKDLLDKIHLYNAVLQLGLPSSIQQPLIDALVAQMYKTNLDACHLEALEITVCRFYSVGVPVLDPVLSHFVGTYSFRTLRDRQNPAPDSAREESNTSKKTPAPKGDKTAPTAPARSDIKSVMPELDDDELADQMFDFIANSNRQFLDYAVHKNPERTNYPDDTFILPPKLQVLGDSLRHWSGVRRNGSTAAAHTGYPLNVGKVRKFYRRRATDANRTATRNTDFLDYSTYRLKEDGHYIKFGAGQPVDAPPDDDAPDTPATPITPRTDKEPK